MSRKGREAAPHFQLRRDYRRGRFAALSRHKAAPTGTAPALGTAQYLGRLQPLQLGHQVTQPVDLVVIQRTALQPLHIHPGYSIVLQSNIARSGT